MNQKKILILNNNPKNTDILKKICMRRGNVSAVSHIEKAKTLLETDVFDVLVADYRMAHFSHFKGILKKNPIVILTGDDIAEIRKVALSWPLIFFLDLQLTPANEYDNHDLLRTLSLAFEYTSAKSEVEHLKEDIERKSDKVREAFSEIKGLKSFLSNRVIKEVEKRVAVEAKYVGYKKEKQRIEDILKKLYMANDVTSLLDIVCDIKEIVQAKGISIYILDENETLGKFLKPAVWDNSFLDHPEFSKHFVLIDAQDYAAYATRNAEEINSKDINSDQRLSRRYIDQLKYPLNNILCVPIMHDKEVIGVVEVYNKIQEDKLEDDGFTTDDQRILQQLSEHISIAITKLNLIQYDALTGLLRSDFFFENVIQTINMEKKRQKEGSSYGIVMGDVDWFKYYNDRNGHEAGNKLLRELASVLESSIRDEDLLCRYGGEEFLFFLSGLNSEDEAHTFTERIRKNVEENYFDFQEFQPNNNLTMSFGLSFFSRERIKSWDAINKRNLKKIVNEADIALALAKGKKTSVLRPFEYKRDFSGKNKVRIYETKKPDEAEKPYETRQVKDDVEKERRKHKRFSTSTLLIYKTGGFQRVAKTINLSYGGVKIPTGSQLDAQQILDLTLIIEDNAFQIKGDVIYSKLSGDEYMPYHTGIKFVELDDRNKKVLEKFFAAHGAEEKSLTH
jgi:diguanylate cyclase (GGDEF)-like protein